MQIGGKPENEGEIEENETETDEDKEQNKQKFIRSVCEKTGIKVYVPKWTVGGAGSSPDLVMFENSNCRAQESSYFIRIYISTLNTGPSVTGASSDTSL